MHAGRLLLPTVAIDHYHQSICRPRYSLIIIDVGGRVDSRDGEKERDGTSEDEME